MYKWELGYPKCHCHRTHWPLKMATLTILNKTNFKIIFLQFLYDLSGTDIDCELFGRVYTCVVPLADFYWTIVLLSCIAMWTYVFCVVYNLIW